MPRKNHPTTGVGLFGTARSEALRGTDFNDFFFAGAGDDRVFGRAGNDTLTGELGDDLLFGGRGNDLIFGEGGNDTVTGGSGADLFVQPFIGVTRITNFNPAKGDTIGLNIASVADFLTAIRDPFAEGFVRIVDGAEGAELQFNPFGRR